MSYKAMILADSIAPGGERLTTFELTFPRFILAELNTHRLLSRNSASSRAIPTPKLLQRVRDNPVMPAFWGRNQSGMQAAEQLDEDDIAQAELAIHCGSMSMIDLVEELNALDLHKQNANRYIEPWLWHTAIVSATEWDNFFALRDTWPDPDSPPGPAQPEFALLARMMREARDASTPRRLAAGEWHLPLVELEDESSPLYVSRDEVDEIACKPIPSLRLVAHIPAYGVLCSISAARCARVSYLTHDGRRDLADDLALHDRLAAAGHWSPFEHVAQAMPPAPTEIERVMHVQALITEYLDMRGSPDEYVVRRRAIERELARGPASRWSGNFRGWTQYRKLFAGEHVGHAPGGES